jgi:hypothetical protein
MEETQIVEEVPAPSKLDAVELLKAAHTQVATVLAKAEESFNMLQTNLQTVRDQRIALSAQKQMLSEILTRTGNL